MPVRYMHSKQANSVPFVPKVSSEETRVEGEGRWMNMQQAIVVTGLTERTLRRHIKKGWVKVRRNGKRPNSPVELWITSEVSKLVDQDDSDDSDVVEIFDAAPGDVSETLEVEDTLDEQEQKADTPASNEASKSAGGADIETVLRSITSQFLERLDQSNEAIFLLRTELQDKDRQLKLLPDLQKQASERELAELKSIALEKQVEELKSQNEKLKEEAEAANEKARLAQQKKGFWSWFTGSGKDS